MAVITDAVQEPKRVLGLTEKQWGFVVLATTLTRIAASLFSRKAHTC